MSHPIVSKPVTIPLVDSKNRMQAHLARPLGAERLPCCIICPKILGATHHVIAAAARVAAEGYVTIVPDFHHRWAANVELAETDAG